MTDRKESYSLWKLQRMLSSMATSFKHWDIKINEEKIREILLLPSN
jgi:hypothetical protein